MASRDQSMPRVRRIANAATATGRASATDMWLGILLPQVLRVRRRGIVKSRQQHPFLGIKLNPGCYPMGWLVFGLVVGLVVLS
jgi:hypothetical protein